MDLRLSPKFKALRGLFFTQQELAAGYTLVAVPGDARRKAASRCETR